MVFSQTKPKVKEIVMISPLRVQHVRYKELTQTKQSRPSTPEKKQSNKSILKPKKAAV